MSRAIKILSVLEAEEEKEDSQRNDKLERAVYYVGLLTKSLSIQSDHCKRIAILFGDSEQKPQLADREGQRERALKEIAKEFEDLEKKIKEAREAIQAGLK
jgi:hypothetical protein